MAYHKCASIYGTNNSAASVQTASGAIANFNTKLAMPLKSLKVDVNATQEAGTPTPQSPKAISGVSAVNVVNQNDKASFFRGLLLGTYGFVDLGSLTWYTDNFDTSYFWRARIYDKKPRVSSSVLGNTIISNEIPQILSSGTEIKNAVIDNIKAFSENVSNNVGGICLTGYDTSLTPAQMSNAIQGVYLIYELATPTTPTITPEQFETLCTAFGISGTTEVINLGGTYYGGYVEQDKNGKRELVVTWGSVVLSTLDWNYNTSNNCWRINDFTAIKTPINASPASALAEQFPVIKAQGYATSHEHNTLAINANKSIFCDNNSTENEPEGLMIYELAEPFTIDLPDGTPIKTLPGVNNIYADTGDTKVAFKKLA